MPARRSEDYEEVSVRVTATSGFTLRRVFTSVPTRLMGHRRSARVHADHIALTLGTDHCLTVPRKPHQAGQGAIHVINYRHVIGALKTQPGALLNLVYRDDLFPRVEYQQCFETALEKCGAHDACRLTVKLLAMAHEDNCESA
ncbi:MAG: IS21 family transposase, partial [Rhodobacteraceae bacterium]|nr:IS21 family transposase [Paracoccaceae bacterium]